MEVTASHLSKIVKEHHWSTEKTSISHQHHIDITSTSYSLSRQKYVTITSLSYPYHMNITSPSHCHHISIMSTSLRRNHIAISSPSPSTSHHHNIPLSRHHNFAISSTSHRTSNQHPPLQPRQQIAITSHHHTPTSHQTSH